nr:hypothetical protein CFP56_03200 [Quercus suber]
MLVSVSALFRGGCRELQPRDHCRWMPVVIQQLLRQFRQDVLARMLMPHDHRHHTARSSLANAIITTYHCLCCLA